MPEYSMQEALKGFRVQGHKIPHILRKLVQFGADSNFKSITLKSRIPSSMFNSFAQNGDTLNAESTLECHVAQKRAALRPPWGKVFRV